MDILERFFKYVSFETTSDPYSDTFPSSEKEIPLLMELKDELKDLGVDAIYKDGYTYGKIISDTGKTDTLFLMAHVDTSPDASGKNVKPRIVHFDGNPISLGNGKVLDTKTFPSLKHHIGHDLIVTDGTTLLGSDDKSGCALIMDFVERALNRGNYPNIVVCFTPDEEIGRGTERIDVNYIKEGVKGDIVAYTLDGGELSEFNSENFNAASAKVTFFGTSVHPSIGKGILVNAQEVAQEFHKLLPSMERPEYTEKREPFILLTASRGSIEEATFEYIIRNFDLADLERQKNDFIKAQNEINKKYGSTRVKVEIKDSYFNMKNIIDKNPKSVEYAKTAYMMKNVEFKDTPVRGGTDGATLSYKGIPCPNLATGGDNFHGVYEYLDINEFFMMREILFTLMDLIK